MELHLSIDGKWKNILRKKEKGFYGIKGWEILPSKRKKTSVYIFWYEFIRLTRKQSYSWNCRNFIKWFCVDQISNFESFLLPIFNFNFELNKLRWGFINCGRLEKLCPISTSVAKHNRIFKNIKRGISSLNLPSYMFPTWVKQKSGTGNFLIWIIRNKNPVPKIHKE